MGDLSSMGLGAPVLEAHVRTEQVESGAVDALQNSERMGKQRVSVQSRLSGPGETFAQCRGVLCFPSFPGVLARCHVACLSALYSSANWSLD